MPIQLRPTILPRWNDVQEGSSTYNVEPTSGLKDTGWAAGDKPGAQHVNWLFNKIYHYTRWMDSQLGAQTQRIPGTRGFPDRDNLHAVAYFQKYMQMRALISSIAQQADDLLIPIETVNPTTGVSNADVNNEISAVRVFVQDSSGTANLLTAKLEKIQAGSAPTVLHTQGSAATAAPQTITLGGDAQVLSNGQFYMVRIVHATGQTPTIDVFGIEVDYVTL